jgi:hypothetical protein
LKIFRFSFSKFFCHYLTKINKILILFQLIKFVVSDYSCLIRKIFKRCLKVL